VNDQRPGTTITSTSTPTVGPLTSSVVVGGVNATHLEVSAQSEGRVNVGIRRGAVGVALIGDLEDLLKFAITLSARLIDLQGTQAYLTSPELSAEQVEELKARWLAKVSPGRADRQPGGERHGARPPAGSPPPDPGDDDEDELF
jgi:hypothetical protein